MRKLSIASRYPGLSFDVAKVRSFLLILDKLNFVQIPPGSLSITFLNEGALAEVHRSFLNDSDPTDVITFPGNPLFGFSGEILISVDYALQHYQKFNWSFSEELSLYMIHGCLHLAGYDDTSSETVLKMREAEKRALESVAIHHAFPYFSINYNNFNTENEVLN